MAAALQPLRNNGASALHNPVYPTTDYQDIRYSSTSQNTTSQRASAFVLGNSDRSGWDSSLNTANEPNPRRSYEFAGGKRDSPTWVVEQNQPYRIPPLPEIQPLSTQLQHSHSPEPQANMLTYSRPPSVTRRRVERYSLDGSERAPSRSSAAEARSIDNTKLVTPTIRELPSESSTPRLSTLNSVNIAGLGSGNNFSIPLSASPSYMPPVGPNPRANVQQPTYITPPTTPTPIRTIYSPRPPPPEEVCVECAMRDQDMADVDVTSPGVWDRESDIAFQDLKRRELEDEKNGLIPDSSKPRARGGHLTEQNLKLWLSINPREPASRQQTLKAYVTSQRALLEAEAVARARAQQESKQLDSRMREHLRRSVYDAGANAMTLTDDTSSLRIKPPRSPTSRFDATHAHSQSRDITLLENGMIVEHVDVRKEEKEARDRKRKEERARRPSRSSVTLDMTSIMSGNSVGPATDGGMTTYPRYSQASYSDIHSLGSASPRRTRFLGIKSLSPGWRSQDSLAQSAMSGSMVDMHVALQREGVLDSNTPRRSQLSATFDLAIPDSDPAAQSEDKYKKKRKKLAKIWGMVTGKHGSGENIGTRQPQYMEDDLPLAPPPPLSYLVNRSSGDLRGPNNRHVSGPSQTFSSQKATVPSNASTLPSPPPSRLSEVENADSDRTITEDTILYSNDTIDKTTAKNVHPVTSEPNMRRHSQSVAASAPAVPPSPGSSILLAQASRDKSLPPLPGEPGSRISNHTPEARPRTMYTYDPQQRPPGASPAHDFLPISAPFRTQDARRQSFNGLSSLTNLLPQPAPQQITAFDTRPPFGPHYDEFGASRGSLGPLEQFKPVQQTTSKRRSKFVLSKILGKKNSHASEQEDLIANALHQFPSMNCSGSAGDDDAAANSYTASNSRHSMFSSGRPSTRMSLNSRKALEERVPQDSQFVAYRYPSGDQYHDLFQ